MRQLCFSRREPVRDEALCPLVPSAQPTGLRAGSCVCVDLCIVPEGTQVMSTGPGGNHAPCLTSASQWCPDTWMVWTLRRCPGAWSPQEENSGRQAPPTQALATPGSPVAVETPCGRSRPQWECPRAPRLCFQLLFWALLPSLVLLCFCYIMSPSGTACGRRVKGSRFSTGGVELKGVSGQLP